MRSKSRWRAESRMAHPQRRRSSRFADRQLPRSEDFGALSAKEQLPRLRHAVGPPLRNCARRDAADHGNFDGPAQAINEFGVRVLMAHTPES